MAIYRNLIEKPVGKRSANGGLFGRDRNGRPIRARRVREVESGLGVRGDDAEYAQAAPSAPRGWRRHVMRASDVARHEGHPVADRLDSLLEEYPADEDREQERYSSRQAAESRQAKRVSTLARRIREGTALERRVALEEWAHSLKK
jgi:hypothetical protein